MDGGLYFGAVVEGFRSLWLFFFMGITFTGSGTSYSVGHKVNGTIPLKVNKTLPRLSLLPL